MLTGVGGRPQNGGLDSLEDVSSMTSSCGEVSSLAMAVYGIWFSTGTVLQSRLVGWRCFGWCIGVAGLGCGDAQLEPDCVSAVTRALPSEIQRAGLAALGSPATW